MVTPGQASWRRLLCRARPLTLFRASGWLVIAPHADDETLGAGGLIAELSARGTPVVTAILTDGSRSHVGAPGWSERRIATLRAAEAREALRRLGATRAPVMLGWRDAAPHAPGTPAFAATVRRLVALCRRHRIRHIVTSWGDDPHCDHEAAAQVARAVAQRLRARLSFYAVWGWTRPDLDARLAGLRARALPVHRWRGHQRRALAANRSQLGGRIPPGRERFVLPRAMRRLVDRPHLILLEPPHAP